MTSSTTKQILPDVQQTIEKLLNEFNEITNERKAIIQQLTDFISQRSTDGQKVRLNFICTHNSRRSHMSQIWAQTAAYYYGVDNVETFSGGTEATAVNHRAVSAMKQAGFDISTVRDGTNPIYEVRFANDAPSLTLFSKKYNDDFNPKNNFAAVMTCSHADDNCPLVEGAVTRIALTYDDPKEFDGTPAEAAKYTERVHDIGRELLYAFSKVNKKYMLSS